MRTTFIAALLLSSLALAACASDPSARLSNAATTPLSDLNLVKVAIPEALTQALAGPYKLPADQACGAVAAQIRALDEALGPDLDAPASADNPGLIERGGAAAEGAALGALKRTAEGVIPFRSWVRKLTGAESHSRQFAAAIAAGTVRRAFLKGLNIAHGCDALHDRVDALLAPLVAAHQFSGAVVLTRQGQVVYQRGFGMARHGAGLAFGPDTPSDGASLAKTFTAAGIWWLVHEGRIEPDAPVARYLPEFPHASTTVRQLLSHSNGLPPDYGFFDPHFGAGETRTAEAMLRAVARHAPEPAFTPGERFEYSNFGYDVAALLIERVSGQPYARFLEQRFFGPLGLRASFLRPPRLADWPGVRTLGYRWRDAAWQVVEVNDGEAFYGASNIYSSAADLALWAAAHAAGKALPGAVEAAGRQRPLIAGQPSAINGLSWYCDEPGLRCWYTGSLNAFHSLVYWDRQRDEAAAFVSNSSLPAWQTIGLQRDLVEALAGLPARPAQAAEFVRFGRATRAAIAGIYAGSGTGLVSVGVAADGGLRLRQGGGLELEMFQVSAEVFYVPGQDLWLAFGGGAVPTTLHLRSMLIDASLRRAPEPGE